MSFDLFERLPSICSSLKLPPLLLRSISLWLIPPPPRSCWTALWPPIRMAVCHSPMIAAMCCFPYACSLFSSLVKEKFSSTEKEAGMVVSGLKWELVLSSYSMESLAFFLWRPRTLGKQQWLSQPSCSPPLCRRLPAIRQAKHVFAPRLRLREARRLHESGWCHRGCGRSVEQQKEPLRDGQAFCWAGSRQEWGWAPGARLASTHSSMLQALVVELEQEADDL